MPKPNTNDVINPNPTGAFISVSGSGISPINDAGTGNLGSGSNIAEYYRELLRQVHEQVGTLQSQNASSVQQQQQQVSPLKEWLQNAGMNNAAVNNVTVGSANEGLSALGQSIALAQLGATDSANALSKYMWEQGEANTDRRLQQQMDFTHNEAQNAMDYQTRMSNTAHQREVADLIAAGLNPVLSANNGASTPSGMMGGASAVGANGFQAAQANVVGAYSAAGEFISSLLNLKETIRQFDYLNDDSRWFWRNLFSSVGRLFGSL